jgi:hypothetical protein
MRRRPACKLSTRHGSLYSAKTPKFTYLQRAEKSRGRQEGGGDRREDARTCHCTPW